MLITTQTEERLTSSREVQPRVWQAVGLTEGSLQPFGEQLRVVRAGARACPLARDCPLPVPAET